MPIHAFVEPDGLTPISYRKAADHFARAVAEGRAIRTHGLSPIVTAGAVVGGRVVGIPSADRPIIICERDGELYAIGKHPEDASTRVVKLGRFDRGEELDRAAERSGHRDRAAYLRAKSDERAGIMRAPDPGWSPQQVEKHMEQQRAVVAAEAGKGWTK